ncbi:hypothetical protein IC766_14325 [Acinetobacter seifertii]|uniref:hypothetical protein n=1 Tax=Acinetobacter seifertii TaxID=1530123 RepID=UPI00168BB166|nr:hypothetical protein [Acinetobacter seifertii]QNY13277.1 hypothetical protein IC766_14325 [Acinetobacter seifertii]
MQEQYLKYWDKDKNIYKSKDGIYVAHEKKNGSFECFKDEKLIGKFYSDYELNSYLGYSGESISSFGAKGYGNFSL